MRNEGTDTVRRMRNINPFLPFRFPGVFCEPFCKGLCGVPAHAEGLSFFL